MESWLGRSIRQTEEGGDKARGGHWSLRAPLICQFVLQCFLQQRNFSAIYPPGKDKDKYKYKTNTNTNTKKIQRQTLIQRPLLGTSISQSSQGRFLHRVNFSGVPPFGKDWTVQMTMSGWNSANDNLKRRSICLEYKEKRPTRQLTWI